MIKLFLREENKYQFRNINNLGNLKVFLKRKSKNFRKSKQKLFL